MSNYNLLTRSALLIPSRVVSPPWWIGHIPFAMWLVQQIQPKLLVELGTHTGNSYFAMCHSVKSNALKTSCFAVDTWVGDAHQGSYTEEVYLAVREFNERHYKEFSHLLRMTFDEALPEFEEKSIDLLHIDGLHTYEAVKHDFDTWLPKLSDSAVVLFHDTNVIKEDFCVWKFWQELSSQYPNIHFDHSQGLGVLFVGRNQSKEISSLLNYASSGENEKLIKNLFFRLGQAIEMEFISANPSDAISRLNSQIADYRILLATRDESLQTLEQTLATRDESLQTLEQTLASRVLDLKNLQIDFNKKLSLIEGLRIEINALRDSTSWRITRPIRRISSLAKRFTSVAKILRHHQKSSPGFKGLFCLSKKCFKIILKGDLFAAYRRQSKLIRMNLEVNHCDRLHQESIVLIKDDAKNPPLKESLNLAIHSHIFYLNLADELLDYLRNIPVKFTLYISTDTEDKADHLRSIFDNFENLNILKIMVTPNRGRDLAPMIVTFGADLIKHELVLHIHTKRSPHNAILRGWRRYLMESLLGSRKRVHSIIQEFIVNPKLGILFPQPYKNIRRCMNMGGNRHNIEKLLVMSGVSRALINDIPHDYFPSGSMFWFRGNAIKPIVELGLKYQDFDPEEGQTDATLAHSIERMFPFFAGLIGFESSCYSTYQFDPDSGFSQFDWLEYYISQGIIDGPIIIFDHDRGGGANVYSENLILKYATEGKHILRCSYREGHWVAEWIKQGDSAIFLTVGQDSLFKTLALTKSKSIVLNSLYGIEKLDNFVRKLIFLAKDMGASLDYRAHDFNPLCPSPHLLDYTNSYCGVPKSIKICNECLRKNRSWFIEGAWQDNIEVWRKPFSNLLDNVDRITFFDRSTLDIYQKVFRVDASKVLIRPHDSDYFTYDKKLDISGKLHIGFLGTLTMVKGGKVINDLFKYIEDMRLKTLITVVGDCMLPTHSKIKVLGSYVLEDLPSLVSENHINLIFASSIVPETFSYTITEAMKMGLPILAFDIGAQGNRVKGYPFGKVLPLGSSSKEIFEAMQSLLQDCQRARQCLSTPQ